MQHSPALSVILAVSHQRTRGARCLKHVLEQEGIEQVEVVLFDDLLGTADPLPGSDHPSVRVLPMPTPRTYGHMIAAGFRHASAPIVALIEEHAYPLEGWAKATIQAHQGNNYAIVSGEFHNANPNIGASNAIHFADHWRTSPPRPKGETTLILGNNSSFKRDAVLAYGDDLSNLTQNDSLLSLQLMKDGYKLYADPAIKVMHCNETRHRSHWLGLYLSSRAMGAVRSRRWSLARRAFYIAIAPGAPFVRLTRQLIHILQARPHMLGEFVKYAPILWSYHAAAVAGQFVGLILGTGKAAERFCFFEMNEFRDCKGVTVERIFTPVFGKLP